MINQHEIFKKKSPNFFVGSMSLSTVIPTLDNKLRSLRDTKIDPKSAKKKLSGEAKENINSGKR